MQRPQSMSVCSHQDLPATVRELYREFGPPKLMGKGAEQRDRPHYFLERNFLGESDLAVLFNTLRCQHQCNFCTLPTKSSKSFIEGDDIASQFIHVLHEVRHSLGILERLTLGNEGSVFDEKTFPNCRLIEMVRATNEIPNIKRIVFETRHEYFTAEKASFIKRISKKNLNVLTGFETIDCSIRNEVSIPRQSRGL
jgi:uncharacterized Fe-S cluster-containing MiaB family protein